MEQQEQISKLTLVLLYLTSWQEKEVQRSWKGYDFDVLNKLEEDGLIAQSKTAKSIYFPQKRNRRSEEIAEGLESLISIFDGPESQTQASILKSWKTTES